LRIDAALHVVGLHVGRDLVVVQTMHTQSGGGSQLGGLAQAQDLDARRGGRRRRVRAALGLHGPGNADCGEKQAPDHAHERVDLIDEETTNRMGWNDPVL
jgi:hypothetical protein